MNRSGKLLRRDFRAWKVAWPFWFLIASCLSLSAAGLPSREEVLDLVYPEATFQVERIFLTGPQKEKAAELAGEELPTALIARYIALRNNQVVGRAYVDTHVVRTKKESLLICLEADGTVKRIEVTAFLEPPEYRASETWYRQYQGRDLRDDLRLQRSIRPIAGATLTTMAANQAVRRVLAIDQVLNHLSMGSP